MKKNYLLLLLIPLTLSACSRNNKESETTTSESTIISETSSTESEESSLPSEESEEIISENTSEEIIDYDEVAKEGDIAYNLAFESLLVKDENNERITIRYTVHYNDNFFSKKGSELNLDMAVVAFALETKCFTKEEVQDIVPVFGFKDIVYSTDYDDEETKDSMLFYMANKTIGEDNVMLLSMSSFNYSKPWMSNFEIGVEGDAEGFARCSNMLVKQIKDYKESHNINKIWINGYSRSAGVCSLAAHYLLEEEVFDEDNLYGYFFDAPNILDVNNYREHPSIHNLINNYSVITHFAPASYGLRRPGHDIDIVTNGMDDAFKYFSNGISLPTFTPNNFYQNEEELINWMLDQLTKVSVDSNNVPYEKNMATREKYSLYYQESIGYILSVFFVLKDSTQDEIGNKFLNESISLLANITNEDALYDFISPILDKNDEKYDEELLKASLNNLTEFALRTLDATFMLNLASETSRNSFLRTIYFHTTEGYFPALIEYRRQTQNN